MAYVVYNSNISTSLPFTRQWGENYTYCSDYKCLIILNLPGNVISYAFSLQIMKGFTLDRR